ncbi:hypothetical protein [Cellulomonas iranensis]|uniref:hypothetical protein n=1 Tax=Cellulomonas iranensis TaxID=76862 RepID=UPI000B3D3E52|nr:hypothetical protein [Cellulomonas iranensis]
MLLDHLMGPRVIREGQGMFTFGSSFTISISDVRDIVDAVSAVFPEVTVNRAVWNGSMWVDGAAIDLDNVSDGDLRHFTISGGLRHGVPSVPLGNAHVRLGAKMPPHVSVEHHPQPGEDQEEITKLADRIEFIVTANGRRRVPPWKWAQHLRLLATVAAVAVWLVVTVTTWPHIHWSLVAAAALTAFVWQADGQATRRDLARPPALLGVPGRVRVDATDREQLRINRAERHWNAWAIAAALVAAVLGGWAQWFFGVLPQR